MGRAIFLHATSTSHGIVKTCWAGLERWGGGGYGAKKSASSSHTHKGKQDGGQWGIFTNFDIFSTLFFVQHLGPDACSAVRGQQFRAKNIKVTKNIFKHFLEFANILYSTRA